MTTPTENSMNYTIHTPPNYVPPDLPGGLPWVEALESGIYPQCCATLCDGVGYCCLGVLSKIQGRLRPDRHEWRDADKAGILSEHNPLTPCMSDPGGGFPEGTEVSLDSMDGPMVRLTSLNDNGLTFSQIAHVIRTLWNCMPATLTPPQP